MSQAPPSAAAIDYKYSESSQRVGRLTFYFGLVYFCQGVSQLVCLMNQPLRYYLRKGHNYDADQTANFFFFASVPWMIKPLYGLISDFVPFLGYRRKSYLILLNFLAAGAFLYVTGVREPTLVLLAMFVTGLGVAASDVIVDALMVEAGQETGKVRVFQGVQWLCINVAGVGSGFLGAWICKTRPPGEALGLAAVVAAMLPLVVAAMTWWAVREQRSTLNLPQLKSTAGGFVAAFKSLRLWMVAGFLVLTVFNPGLITPMYYHLQEKIGVDESFLGLTDAFFSMGSAAGSLLFLLVMTGRLSTRMSITIGMVAVALGTMPFFFVKGKTSASMAYVTWGFGYMLASLASLSLAAQICPKRAEGFVFAGLMALVNLSMQYSDKLGSALYVGTLQRNVYPLVACSIIFPLASLIMLPFLPTRPVYAEREVSGFPVLPPDGRAGAGGA